MKVRIFFRENALFIDTVPTPFVAGTLVAVMNGERVEIRRFDSDFVFAVPRWSDVARHDGSTFDTPDAAMAYLASEFARQRATTDQARRFVHLQPAPSAIWTVPHNLGVRPSVTVLSTGGVEMWASIAHLSDNVLQVIMDDALSGQAICL